MVASISFDTLTLSTTFSPRASAAQISSRWVMLLDDGARTLP